MRAVFKAFETYVPENDSIELSFKEGDLLEQTDMVAPDGWLHCRLNGATGLVPENYVDEYDSQTDSDDGSESENNDEGDEGDDNSDTDDGVRICMEDFIIEVGALNEVTIREGDRLQLLDDQETPEGWVRVQNIRSNDIGMVPEAYIGLPARDDDLTEDQVELLKQKEKNSQLQEELERTRTELMMKLQDTKKQKDLEIDRVHELKEAEAKKRQDAIEALEAFKNLDHMMLKSELKGVEEQKAEQERIAWLEVQQREAREAAEEHYASGRSVIGRKRALDAAEAERSKAELEFNRIDAARARAERRLLDAQRKVDDCTEELRTEESAREANERTLMLLPGLRELMAPTQAELRSCLETVTSAVMRNAEQSARLLATMAGANPGSGAPRSGTAATTPQRNQPCSTTRTAAPQATTLLKGPPLLGATSAGTEHIDRALAMGRMSLPERIRCTTARANAGTASVSQGVAKAPESVGKSKERSVNRSAMATADGSSHLPGDQRHHFARPAARVQSRGQPRPTSRPSSHPVSRASSAPGSGAGACPRSWESSPEHEDGLPSGETEPISPRHEFTVPSATISALSSTLQRVAVAAPASEQTIERQLQLGKALSAVQSDELQQKLREATARMCAEKAQKNVQQIRTLVIAPERRVKDRFETSSAAHVRRAQAAREAAAAKQQRFAASCSGRGCDSTVGGSRASTFTV